MFEKVNSKIFYKLLFYVTLVVILGSAITQIVSNYSINKISNSNARKSAQKSLNEYHSFFQHSMSKPLYEIEIIKEMILSQRKENKKFSRKEMIEFIKNILENRKDYLGISLLFEPNQYDGQDFNYIGSPYHDKTGRFVPYINRGSGEIKVEALLDYEDDIKGEYYQLPKKTFSTVLINPYFYPINGKEILITSIIVPIIDENKKFLGIVGVDFSLDFFQNKLDALKFEAKSNIKIFDESGTCILATHKEIIGKKVENLSKGLIPYVRKKEAYQDELFSDLLHVDIISTGMPFQLEGSKEKWMILFNVDKNDETYKEDFSKIQIIVSVFGLLIAVSIIFTLYLLSKKMTLRLNQLESGVSTLADGKFPQNIKDTSKDEIGKSLHSLNFAVQNIQPVISNLSNNSNTLDKFANELESNSNHLNDLLLEQSASMEEIASSVDELAASLGNMEDFALEQNDFVNKFITEFENFIGELKTSNEKTSNAKIKTNEMKKLANQGKDSLTSLEFTIDSISKAGLEMFKIVRVITEVSAQVNLLSLNASIEAARAGDAGKGFAVVADEISKLADKTSSSIKGIQEIIKNNDLSIKDSSKEINITINNLTKLIDSVNSLQSNVNEVEESSQIQLTSGMKLKANTIEVGELTKKIQSIIKDETLAIREVSTSTESVADKIVISSDLSSKNHEISSKLASMSKGIIEKMKFFKL